VRTLIGHEYEVRVEDFDRGTIDGWFRAKYLTPHARQMGWLWEIDDPRFVRLKLEEVSIVEVRPLSNTTDHRQVTSKEDA
jgi:predicted transposase YdaD